MCNECETKSKESMSNDPTSVVIPMGHSIESDDGVQQKLSELKRRTDEEMERLMNENAHLKSELEAAIAQIESQQASTVSLMADVENNGELREKNDELQTTINSLMTEAKKSKLAYDDLRKKNDELDKVIAEKNDELDASNNTIVEQEKRINEMTCEIRFMKEQLDVKRILELEAYKVRTDLQDTLKQQMDEYRKTLFEDVREVLSQTNHVQDFGPSDNGSAPTEPEKSEEPLPSRESEPSPPKEEIPEPASVESSDEDTAETFISFGLKGLEKYQYHDVGDDDLKYVADLNNQVFCKLVDGETKVLTKNDIQYIKETDNMVLMPKSGRKNQRLVFGKAYDRV